MNANLNMYIFSAVLVIDLPPPPPPLQPILGLVPECR